MFLMIFWLSKEYQRQKNPLFDSIQNLKYQQLKVHSAQAELKEVMLVSIN